MVYVLVFDLFCGFVEVPVLLAKHNGGIPLGIPSKLMNYTLQSLRVCYPQGRRITGGSSEKDSRTNG